MGIFPGNHEDLVTALIDKLEDAPPVNQIVRVEFLEERNTALGNGRRYGRSLEVTVIHYLAKVWTLLASQASFLPVAMESGEFLTVTSKCQVHLIFS